MGYRWRVNDNRALFPGTQVHQRDRTRHLDFFGTLKEKRWRSRYCSVPVRYVGRLKATRKSVQVVRIQEWKNGQKAMTPSYIIIAIIVYIYIYIMPNMQGRLSHCPIRPRRISKILDLFFKRCVILYTRPSKDHVQASGQSWNNKLGQFHASSCFKIRKSIWKNHSRIKLRTISVSFQYVQRCKDNISISIW